MTVKEFKTKSKRRLLQFLYSPQIFLRSLFVLPKQERKILALAAHLPALAQESSLHDTFFASSFRVTSEDRLSILKTAFNITCKQLTNKVLVVADDASDEPYASACKAVVEALPAQARYTNNKARLNSSYFNMLTAAEQKYFFMLFDDFPVIGMTEDFLVAAQRLLADFEGLVEVVFVEGVTEYSVNDEQKKVYYNLKSRDFEKHRDNLVCTVTYGQYQFAILKNFHYGFFFNTIFTSAKDYARRLGWYMEHIDKNSPHAIELAASVRVGPVYDYIAVPLEVFNFDIDYAHTDISIRAELTGAKQLKRALCEGYVLEGV